MNKRQRHNNHTRTSHQAYAHDYYEYWSAYGYYGYEWDDQYAADSGNRTYFDESFYSNSYRKEETQMKNSTYVKNTKGAQAYKKQKHTEATYI